MAAGKLPLDVVLLLAEPVHRGVALIGGSVDHAQVGGQGGVGPPAGGGQLGRRLQHPGHDQRQRQIALPAWRAEQAGQAQLADGLPDQRDVAVRQRPADLGLAAGDHQLLALEDLADRSDRLSGQVGEVADGLTLDLAALAVGAAQQGGLIDLVLVVTSRGDDVDGAAPCWHGRSLSRRAT